jgi:hypothetical protein
MRGMSAESKSGVALRFPPHSKTRARSPMALLQTLPLQHVQRLGLRRRRCALPRFAGSLQRSLVSPILRDSTVRPSMNCPLAVRCSSNGRKISATQPRLSSLSRLFHTPLENSTERRVRAPGLQRPQSPACRPGAPTRHPRCEISGLRVSGRSTLGSRRSPKGASRHCHRNACLWHGAFT